MTIHRSVVGGPFVNRDWSDYEEGFGKQNNDYWIGLKSIHQMCSRDAQCRMRLKILSKETDELKEVSEFEEFWIDGKNERYRLHVAKPQGNITTYTDCI